ncbi:MAG: hypothetical protein ACAI43_22650 [Phycisphaerae bacterium]|nr:hypothetical protein [Tepidisphaeraceae bacterium]
MKLANYAALVALTLSIAVGGMSCKQSGASGKAAIERAVADMEKGKARIEGSTAGKSPIEQMTAMNQMLSEIDVTDCPADFRQKFYDMKTAFTDLKGLMSEVNSARARGGTTADRDALLRKLDEVKNRGENATRELEAIAKGYGVTMK